MEQVVVEVEIENTLFKNHTYQQLEIMGQFLGEQKRKNRKAHGLLAVPDSANMKVQAEMLLGSLFPSGHQIIVEAV
jgi:hypothetical protein